MPYFVVTMKKHKKMIRSLFLRNKSPDAREPLVDLGTRDTTECATRMDVISTLGGEYMICHIMIGYYISYDVMIMANRSPAILSKS